MSRMNDSTQVCEHLVMWDDLEEAGNAWIWSVFDNCLHPAGEMWSDFSLQQSSVNDSKSCQEDNEEEEEEDEDPKGIHPKYLRNEYL